MDNATARDCARYLSALLKLTDDGRTPVAITIDDMAAISAVAPERQVAVRNALRGAGVLRIEVVPMGYRLALGGE
jgi:hypothetical protein